MADQLPVSMARAVRKQLSRGLLRLLAPRIDATAAEGGLGAHPLGSPAPSAWWSTLPEASTAGQTLLGAALTAGVAESGPTAIAQVLSWLAADHPGQGPDWQSPDRVACRLIHLAAVHAWVDLTDDDAQRLAGSARAHGAWLFQAQVDVSGSADLALVHAALLIAGQAWPSLPEARSFRGPALGSLAGSLSEAASDGPGQSSPARLARAVWAVALARAWVEANGAAVPAEVDGAFLRASNALWRIGGDHGNLPPDPSIVPLLPLGATPLAHTLQNLTVAWGLQAGPLASAEDRACTLLSAAPTGSVEPMAGPDWRMWAWRTSGVSVAHRTIRKQPARAWCSAPSRALSLSLNGEEILQTQMPDGTLRVARVDGNQATWLYDHGDHTRDIRLRQARLGVTDTGLSAVHWQLPPWPHEATDKGFQARAPGGAQLIIKTDPAWRWVIKDNQLIGTGSPDRIKYSFEIR